jgi:hypothetical protein
LDPFDERILKVLGDGKKRSFSQLVWEVGFSHNTLRLHFDSLVETFGKPFQSKKGLGA